MEDGLPKRVPKVIITPTILRMLLSGESVLLARSIELVPADDLFAASLDDLRARLDEAPGAKG